MLQLRYSKLKQVFMSVLLPRILLRDTKLYNRAAVALDHFSKLRKSTDSTSDEERMRIIEKCFGKSEDSGNEVKDIEESKEVEKENIITPEFYNITRPKQRDTIFSKILGSEPKQDEIINREEKITDAKTYATTSKLEEEQLAQKVEIIDETPHVEAHAPKVEGFNLPPKVLGNDSFILELSKKNEDSEQLNLDEIAKRCLGSPINDIDKILVQELKNINQRKSQPNLDMDFVRNQCVRKSHENFTNDQIYYDLTLTNNEYTADKIQPSHLDATPLLKVDDEIKELKENVIIREFSTIYFTTDVDDTVLNTPAPLSPYEKPAMPFYEYINKDSVTSEDETKMGTAAITEETHENEIIFHDEALQRDAIDQERSQVEEIETEQPLNPKPNVSQFSVPLGLHNASEVQDNLCQKLTQSNFLNVFAFQRFFTSSPDQPSGWFPDVTLQKERNNTAISGTLTPESDSRSLEIPSDTAISANQKPDEYYKMSFSDEYFIKNQAKPLGRIFAESPVTQNVIFSALPQQLELKEATVEKQAIATEKDPISDLIFEPETKQNITIEKTVQHHLEELSKQRISISQTEGVPLSLLLKRIREQNRLEYCRDIYSKAEIKLEGTKKFSIPPVDKGKTKGTEKPCPTKPKPACDQIKPCPPIKKDPCAKFSPLFLTILKCDILHDSLKNPNGQSLTSLALITGDIVQRLNVLGQKLRYLSNDPNGSNEVTYARDFDPWIPIPSWPIPKKEKARSFVCPKEGCKIPLPKATKEPYKGKQCLEMPKKEYAMSRVFSSLNIFSVDYSGNM